MIQINFNCNFVSEKFRAAQAAEEPRLEARFKQVTGGKKMNEAETDGTYQRLRLEMGLTRAQLSDVVDHIDHVRKIAGTSEMRRKRLSSSMPSRRGTWRWTTMTDDDLKTALEAVLTVAIEPVPADALADLLGVSVSNATGLIDRMEERGLIERVRPADDRRSVHVRPTPTAVRAAEAMELMHTETNETVLDRLDDEQLDRLAAGLTDWIEALEGVIRERAVPHATRARTRGPQS